MHDHLLEAERGKPTVKLKPRVAEFDSQSNLKQIGARIRRYRRGKFSLEQLAAASGVSAGLISQLERGLGNPSLLNLTKISYALDLTLNTLLNVDGAPRPAGEVVLRDSRRQVLTPDTGLVYELLTPGSDRRLSMLRVVIPPGFDNTHKPFRHDGDESIYVVSGSLQVRVGDDDFQLREGDSLTYEATMPHSWRNRTTAPVDLIGASSPPNF